MGSGAVIGSSPLRDHRAAPSTDSKRGAVYAIAIFSMLCLGAAAYILIQDPFGATPELEFDAALVGPLEEGESYALRVSNVPDGAAYQLFVDGEAVGVEAPGLPYLSRRTRATQSLRRS